MRASIRPTSSRTRLLAAGTTVLAVLALAGLASSPAVAAGPQTTTEEYAYESWFCGYPMQVHGQFTSRFRERQDPHGGDRTLVHENFQFAETWTNAAGRSFTVSAKASSKDLKSVSLGGSAYEVIFQQSGQPQVVTADGVVLARDRGNLRFHFITDIQTGAFEFLGATLNGPHPGFETDLCKIVAPITGNTSAEHQTARPLGTTGAGMGYYEYLPPSYGEAASGSPLLVVTNGYGENGDGSAAGLDLLLFTGIPRFIDVGGWPLDRPFVVLSTQHIEQPPGLPGDCSDVPWPGSCVMQIQHDAGSPPESPCTTPGELDAFLDYAVTAYDVDPDRVYVTGLSCGAFGVWEYLSQHGDERVAAAVPIAGEGRPAWATSGCALSAVPIWAIHGELDDVVNPAGSIDPITALSGCPGVSSDRAKLSIYPGLMHDGWDQAYSGSAGDDIYSWMLDYTRN
ncbi:hypothetical protein [Microbacterium sp. SS28]|uniref:carboxylesterase family protein n=1 Tax=Microbacterium sp. SS28 TaxID=2919948 RepID=UPI001FAA47DA|nr:hypothetical protein [Microbacterium sp. SS28]